jgi:hypothetical protein
MRCIGLISGLAVGSACHCYRILAQDYPCECGPLELCMVHVCIAQLKKLSHEESGVFGAEIQFLPTSKCFRTIDSSLDFFKF